MSDVTNPNHLKNVDNFRKVELSALRKKFVESEIGEVCVVHFKEKDGLYYFQARLKQNGKLLTDEKFLVEGISKDKFKAKDKMLTKLKTTLKAMCCPIKSNPVISFKR